MTGNSAAQGVGLAPSTLVVIETGGSIEQFDSLKAAFDGATATGQHVVRDPLDATLLLPSFAARQIGTRALSTQCQGCGINRTCGGGLFTPLPVGQWVRHPGHREPRSQRLEIEVEVQPPTFGRYHRVRVI